MPDGKLYYILVAFVLSKQGKSESKTYKHTPSAGDGHIGTSIPEKSKMRLHTPASVGKMTISLTQCSDPQTGDPPRSINKAI